ncbi:hypothetical protein [Janibacter terrae]|uniref:hypothetical protein n=1 Tax=Janibacter terrae TaxID=103817 RepID=UPI0031F8C360
MTLPPDLKVSGPFAFDAGALRPADADDDLWVWIEGGELPVPVLVRVDRSPDGRFIATGLHLGLLREDELGWDTMRRIKPATLLNYIFGGFDPADPFSEASDVVRGLAQPSLDALAAGMQDALREYGAEALTQEDYERWRAEDFGHMLATMQHDSKAQRALTAYALWERLAERPPVPTAAAAKPRASVATDLNQFAQVYLKHRAATPRRATQATADELHCSRATVIRRLAEARKLGLIPEKDSK